ncbi:MAG: T9SS type A sorting domain-containing protein [Rhodothermaceae bacterium]|nr:T9SS type A sorting domain-containing protein [Rhodothermaceae bacterium]
MKYLNRVTLLSILLVLIGGAVPAFAQSGLLLSKHADFSTEDRSFDPTDVLYVKVIAPDIDYSDLDKNEFRLKPDEGGNDVEHPLTNNLDGTYTTYVDLSTTDIREDDWEVRVRIEDENDREFEARVDINIGNEDRDDDNDNFDDEVEFTGRIDALEEGGITVDGIFFVVNNATQVLDDDKNPISFSDLSVGQIVEIRGDRLSDSTLVATKIEIEDDFPDNDGDDELEFTGRVDSLGTGAIVVSGVAFVVGDNTIVLDDNNNTIPFSDLFVGQIVEIRGDLQRDGTWLATHIKVEDDVRGDDEVEFTGTIDDLSGSTITVNGTPFTVDQNTVVLDNNNNPFDFAMLVVGQLVEIKGFRQADGSILAVRIKIEDRDDDEVELTGEIERIDGNSLDVAGLTFFVSDNTIILNNDNQPITFADLSVGLIVEIRADVQADGSLLASDIKIEDRLEDEVEVRGLADSVSDSSIVVLGREFHVVATTAVFDNNNNPISLSAVTAGSIVEVKANLLPGGMLVAVRIELEDDDRNRVRVQGPIDAVGVDSLNIAGIYLLLNGATEVVDEDGNTVSISDLAAGQSVDADAQRQETGLPVVTRVEIKNVANMTGSISGITNNSLKIAGSTVTFDASTTIIGPDNEALTIAALSDGQFAKIRTELTGATRKATTVELLSGSVFSVSVDDEFRLPRQFSLNQNYPNPFNPVTTISFDVLGSDASSVTLTIYNVLGQSVRTLIASELNAGSYAVEWNGTSDTGEQMASGMYLYSLQVNGLVQTKTMVLLK